jgi:type II secretory pathway component PulK
MRSERGFAMVWAMLLVIAVGSTTALLVLRGRTVRQEAAADRIRDGSFHAAEGGLAHARHALAQDPAFAGETIVVGGFRVTSEVDRANAGWRVVVIARPGGGRLEATLGETEGFPAIRAWR